MPKIHIGTPLILIQYQGVFLKFQQRSEGGGHLRLTLLLGGGGAK